MGLPTGARWVPCHSCNGRGWIEFKGKPHRCPICGGSGRIREAIDFPRRIRTEPARAP